MHSLGTSTRCLLNASNSWHEPFGTLNHLSAITYPRHFPAKIIYQVRTVVGYAITALVRNLLSF